MVDIETSRYLLKRQRKGILENLGRVAVVGLRTEPIFKSYGATQKLIQYGVTILPVIPECDSVLGVPCYDRLGDIPGAVDIVQVYRQPGLDLLAVAQDAIEKGSKVFWIEDNEAPEPVRKLLTEAQVYLVEYENLEQEYRKHHFMPPGGAAPQKLDPAVRVNERMTRQPVTVKANDSVQDALTKMRKGHFRHLPVVNDTEQLVGMFSDRDLRLVYPSSLCAPVENAMDQFKALTVEQAAVFSPVSVLHDATLEEAAELMLRWNVGALPVIVGDSHLVGIITYSDFLKEFLAMGKQDSPWAQAGQPSCL